jgi:hydrogenase-4 component B
MSVWLALTGAIILGASGFPGLFFSRTSLTGQWLTTLLAVFGAGLGLSGIGVFLATGESQSIVEEWLPQGIRLNVAIDGLSAIFLSPVFLISLLGSIYGLGYWKQTEHQENGRKLRLFYGVLAGSMAFVVLARNGILFLFAWEIMALSAFFLVTTEDDKQDVREAGWIYLVATRMATVFLFALFALLHTVSGSFKLDALNQSNLTAGMASAIFIVALIGFGIKMGIMPVHVWLPSAHASAPSHVSAIMSGVILKMGVYGLVRITSLLPNPPLAWGATVLALGTVSGVLGVALAVGQGDLKRLLAYSSIENIGIIMMGLGLALIGRSLGRADWVILGMSGCLLHVCNHALFKGLLFYTAGSVIHGTAIDTEGTRQIDLLGGLAKAMPWTALCFIIGTVAVCGLPPLNSFVSEFFIYLGLFDTLVNKSTPSFAIGGLAAAALALIGALAVACFVKAYGAVFLGTARSDHARHAHESPASMLGPMGVLAACCLVIGLAPRLLAPVLESGIAAWAPDVADAGRSLVALVPLEWISIAGCGLLAGVCLAWSILLFRLRSNLVEQAATWGCGYRAPNTRMQYTSSSFAQMLVDLFAWALHPRTRKPQHLELFPQPTDFRREVPDAVLDEAALPAFGLVARLFSWLRILQQGNVQIYLLYIFLVLVALLLWQ